MVGADKVGSKARCIPNRAPCGTESPVGKQSPQSRQGSPSVSLNYPGIRDPGAEGEG